MLVVIGVDVRSVVDNPHYFDAVRKHHPRVSIQDLAEIPFPKEVPLELVRGTTFINDRGQEITIGMTQEVQEAIGLPMDVFNSQTEQIDKLNHEVAQKVQEVKELKTALKDYRTMTVWGRVKFLFSGVEDKLAEAYESCAKAVSNTLFK
ncbi:MAG: hypothetical protein GWN76_00800 [candidate division Zixibacteria bacterium]|nr:hypothetical protein [candidate division Zixibacteria bacterium]